MRANNGGYLPMTNWIISANPTKYNVIAAYSKYDLIDWTQSANFEIGDIVYIYVSKPFQKIMFKTEVLATNIQREDAFDDDEFWLVNPKLQVKENKKLARLKQLGFVDSDHFALNQLLKYGLNKAPLGPVKVVETLQKHLDLHFQTTLYDPSEIEEELIDRIFEGAKQQVTVNRYERNPIARRQCLEIHGYNCSVCEMNFEKTYGEIGKEFIHVHHLVPLHEINEEYAVNPETDLIPVCPNCHAMLHRKLDGKYLTLAELKQRIDSPK